MLNRIMKVIFKRMFGRKGNDFLLNVLTIIYKEARRMEL